MSPCICVVCYTYFKLLSTNINTYPQKVKKKSFIKEFDGGRHFHGLSLVEGRPVMVGGWRNGPLADSLVFDECTTTDPTRPGTWQARTAAGHQLTVPREKFVTVSVPKTMVPTPNR